MEDHMRIGSGFDVHALKEGLGLWLGGVSIDHSKGLEGHSDGDALIHAIVDAIFGALGEGDLGVHFPSSDPQWKGARSRQFLEYACNLMNKKGFELVYVDSNLIAQKPVLRPYIPEMRAEIARILECSIEKISIKATTTDHLGFVGREEGIAAQAICLLRASSAKTAL